MNFYLDGRTFAMALATSFFLGMAAAFALVLGAM